MKSIVRLFALSLALGLFLVSTGEAQRPDPNSPRYKGVTRIAEMLKTSGDAALTEFVQDYVADSMVRKIGEEHLLELLENTRQVYGNSDLQGARPVDSFSAKLVFSSVPKGVSDSIEFTVEEKEPFRYVDISLVATKEKAPTAEVPKPSTDAEMVASIKTYMSDLVDKDEFSGAVLLAKNGIPLFQQAYGLASKRFDIPYKIDTKFNLGSMNKMFTGVAICQLVEQGKLSFDDTVAKHLPDYPDKEIAEKVTIHHLLTHTSGLGSYWNEKYEKKWKTIRTVEDLVETFEGEPLAFEPGERFSYSNVGPVVLGLIIEQIAGTSYYDYVRENIYRPAGMLNTDCYENDRPTPNLAIGYTRYNYDGTQSDGPRRNNLFLHSVKGGPAGGGFSTVNDMLRFSEALQAHKLLSKKYTQILINGKVQMGPGFEYAYLFGDHKDEIPRYRFHGHNGGAPGISAELTFYPEVRYTVSVLSNYDGGASKVARHIRAMIKDRPDTNQSD